MQTIVGSYAPTPFPARMPPPEVHDVPVDSGSELRLLLTRPAAKPRGTVVVLNGVGGTADSHLGRRVAVEAWRRGWVAARMNYRTFGGAGHLSTKLPHAGMSGDLAVVLSSPPISRIAGPRVAIGYSIGGNILLKYLGEAGPPVPMGEPTGGAGPSPAMPGSPGGTGRRRHHGNGGSLLAAAVAICPPVELSAAVRRLERPSNLLLHLALVHSLVSSLRERHRLSGNGTPSPSLFRTPTLRAYDARYTAPDGGFASADDYYEKASCAPFLEAIATPTLVLASRDDPIVPVASLRRYAGCNPNVSFRISARGGHCGWIERLNGRFRSRLPAESFEFLESATSGDGRAL